MHGPLLARALAAWSKVTAWLGQHSPRILQSLNPGATAAEVAAAEAALGHPLPSAMRVIYRCKGGCGFLCFFWGGGGGGGGVEEEGGGRRGEEEGGERRTLGGGGAITLYNH